MGTRPGGVATPPPACPGTLPTRHDAVMPRPVTDVEAPHVAAAGGAVWEPGPPTLRAMGPGVVVAGLLPFGVYQLVRPALGTAVPSLLVAAAVPALWVVVQWVVRRSLDPIGLIVLAGLAFGLVFAAAGGGPVAVKARDGAFAAAFGIACLASLTTRRPLMFYVGRALSAGSDPRRVAAFDALWDIPTGPRTFVVITVLWGVGLLVDAAAQAALAVTLATRVFLVVAPAAGGTILASLFAATVGYSRRARRKGELALAGTGITYPSVPLG